MMLLYDEILPRLLSVCESFPNFATSTNAAVAVRDLVGKVRLVIDTDSPQLDLAALEAAISAALGGWFAGPILSLRHDSDAFRRAARGILDGAKPWPDGWPSNWLEAQTQTSRPISACWRAYSRVLAKESWLTATPASPPWPLVAQAPALVSFYSFKGGVGRSSALAIVALQLARRGKRVLTIDLDLEAPGLDSVFGIEGDRGVIDYLLAHAATGRGSVDNLVREPDPARLKQYDQRNGWLGVVPAWGAASASITSHVEKLARLDYLAADADASPVEAALRTLVLDLKRAHPGLDYILIDSRAGLHDIGGLALAALAHVDVVVTRSDRQGLRGLRVVLDAIRRRRLPEQRRICIAHTFARLPIEGDPNNLAEQAAFRRQVWEIFQEVGLYNDDDQIAEDTPGVAHYPITIGTYDEVMRSERLESMSDAVRENDPYRALRMRVTELCSRETDHDPLAE